MPGAPLPWPGLPQRLVTFGAEAVSRPRGRSAASCAGRRFVQPLSRVAAPGVERLRERRRSPAVESPPPAAVPRHWSVPASESHAPLRGVQPSERRSTRFILFIDPTRWAAAPRPGSSIRRSRPKTRLSTRARRTPCCSRSSGRSRPCVTPADAGDRSRCQRRRCPIENVPRLEPAACPSIDVTRTTACAAGGPVTSHR